MNVDGRDFAQSLLPTGMTRYLSKGNSQFTVYITAADQKNLKCLASYTTTEGFGLPHLTVPWDHSASDAHFIGTDVIHGKTVNKFSFVATDKLPFQTIVYVDPATDNLVRWETQHQGHAYRIYTVDVYDYRVNYNNAALYDHSMCTSEHIREATPTRRPLDHATILENDFVEYHEAPEHEMAGLPREVDWRLGKDVRTLHGVWDQGQCGSCWCNSAMETIHGQIARYSNRIDPLIPSRQWCVDCSKSGEGCMGGQEGEALSEMVKNKSPIPTDMAYPYNVNNNLCRTVTDKALVYGTTAKPLVTGVKLIPEGDEAALQHAVATVGPVTVGICVNSDFTDSHDRVIKTRQKCTVDDIIHAVLAVGYGVDAVTGEEYWLVQNSWSYRWKDNGFVRVARNRGSQFAIALGASYPLIDPEVARQFD